MRTSSNIKIFSGRPDMVSLIDLLFLLFLFFLVSTSLIFQPGIPVDLPLAEGTSISAVEKIIVTIAQDGKLFLNDRPVADYALQRQLREVVDNRIAFTNNRLNLTNDGEQRERAPRIIIRADRMVRYDKIVEVMALARSLGLGVYLLIDQDNPTASRRLPRSHNEN